MTLLGAWASLLDRYSEFEGVDRIQPETFIEQGRIGDDIPRSDFFQIQCVDQQDFQFLNQIVYVTRFPSQIILGTSHLAVGSLCQVGRPRQEIAGG